MDENDKDLDQEEEDKESGELDPQKMKSLEEGLLDEDPALDDPDTVSLEDLEEEEDDEEDSDYGSGESDY